MNSVDNNPIRCQERGTCMTGRRCGVDEEAWALLAGRRVSTLNLLYCSVLAEAFALVAGTTAAPFISGLVPCGKFSHDLFDRSTPSPIDLPQDIINGNFATSKRQRETRM